MSISSKIQSLITAANSVTGESRTDLTAAVQDLKDGYPTPRLPAEYQEVEYVESSGTQRIESGIINDTLNVPIYYETNGILFKNTSSRQLVGSQGGYYFGITNGNYWQCGSAGTSNTGITMQANTWYSVKVRYTGVANVNNNGKIAMSIDNNVWAWGAPAWGDDAIATNVASNFNICLFSLNGQNLPASCKIKDFIIYQNNVLVRHFVPCYRKSDNEIGMYDIVNGVFYTNAGTGSFTCYPAPPTP